jgi:tetratricopeptide (TPR) repeat protein
MGQISRVLGARYVLGGNIELFGNQCVVTVELSYVPDRRVIWAERFDGCIDDLPALRLTISSRVAAEIESRIQFTEIERAFRVSTENLDAWSAYHRGQWHMYRFNRADNEIAAHMFQRAVAQDSHFARAYAGLSFTCFQEALLSYSVNTSQRLDLARKHAEKSLQLDPHDPFANLSMGRWAWLADNLDDAVLWLDRCVALSPNYAVATYNRGLIDVLLNDGSKSEERSAKALALSPIDPLRYAFFGTRALSHVVRGDYPAATTWANRSISEPTAHVHMYAIAAMCHELAGNHDFALELTARVARTHPAYTRQMFFRSFQFRDSKTIASIRAAFRRLGMS